MNPQEMNFVAELMAVAEQILAARNTWQNLRERYSANNFNNSITDGELAAIPTFSHLTIDEVRRTMGVLDALVLLIDNNIVIGGNTDLAKNHLIRMKG